MARQYFVERGEPQRGQKKAMLELVGSELVKRAAERARRREERLKALKEGREDGDGGEEEKS